MKLDARFINLVYKIADKDPQLTELNTDNIPEGALWINEVTGKVFIAIKHPDNPAKIVWLMVSDTAEDILSQLDFPTYNIVDIFNDNSIVAFYPFDGNVQDLANGYNGTWHGNEQYDKGVFGQAAKLDGNTYLELPSDIISVFNTYSYSIWVYIPSSVNNWSIVALNARNKSFSTNDSTNRKNGLLEIDSNKRLVHTAKGSADSDQLEKSIDFTPYFDKWVHIVYTQANNTHKVYINGRLIPELTIHTSGSVQLTDVGYANLAFVHYYTNTMCEYAVGLRDQLRIFNRPLTDEEIIILYNENYLIKKALSILVDKFRTYKEIVFFPAGDLPSIQTGTKFHGGQIGQVTDTKPVEKDTGKETIGKELYFLDNSAIELEFNQNITVPFTLATILQVDKLEQTSGVFDKVLIGLDYGGQPADGNFDFWIYLKNGKEISCNVGDNGSDKNASPNAKSIPIEPNNPYLLVVKVDANSVETKVYDFAKKQFTGKFEFTTGNLNKLREPKLALGAWIWTSDTKDHPNQFGWFSNCGLHINQFRIFKGTLTDEEINLLLNEDKFYPVRTQYTPRVFVNKPSLNEDLIVFYNFDKIDTANKKIIDLSGNGRHGILKLAQNETIEQAFTNGIFGRALDCKGVDKRVTINNIPTDVDFITVSFWMRNTVNTPNSAPFGFYHLNLWLRGGLFGFNNDDGAIYGVGLSDIIGYIKKWFHVVAVFPKTVTNSDYSNCELYINGQKQILTYKQSVQSAKTSSITSTAYISGYGNSTNYPFDGYIDQFRMYKRKLTPDEIQTLYREMLWAIK